MRNDRTAWMILLLAFAMTAGPLARADEDSLQWPRAWLYNPIQWSPDASTEGFHFHGDGTTFAERIAAPISERVEIEATVRIIRPSSEQWKVAGVAIVADSRNFWHLALIAPPEGENRPVAMELAEMRDGRWLSQWNLKCTANEGPGTWEMARDYRLRLTLTPDGVEGVATDENGRVLKRTAFAFDKEAVTYGRPALHGGGFEAAFRDIRSSHEDAFAPKAAPVPPYACDSFVPGLTGRATGMFHVEQHGETWWVIDPLGRGFVPLGSDHVRYQGHFCESLGHAPYGRKNDAKYDSPDDWGDETLARLKQWGFNTLSAGISPMLLHRGLAHTKALSIGSRMTYLGDEYNITPGENRPCTAFPNVFHPEWEAFCRYWARVECAPSADDPWLLGYFLDNELAWWGRGDLDTGLFDAAMRKPHDHTAKRALRDFLAERYGADVAKFNAAWGADLESFDALLDRESLTGENMSTVVADKKAFLALAASKYFDALCDAIRASDPNHMVLGCRFAGGRAADVVWQAAGRRCEVLSFNYYGNVDLDAKIARDHDNPRTGVPLPEAFEEFHAMGERPMMVTEWSFPAIDSGLPCTNGAGQRFRTQAERAEATAIFARAILAAPFMVGYDYFMWVDEPELGISTDFPENTNYGLVNEEGVPYEPIVDAFTRLHRAAPEIRRAGLAGLPKPVGDAHPRVLRLPTPADAAPINAVTSTLQFRREGDDVTIDNGVWRLHGKVGGRSGLLDNVTFHDKTLGRFNAMLEQENGPKQWIDLATLTDARLVHEDDRMMVVELDGRFDGDPNGPRRPFAMTVRLTMQSDEPWFLAEATNVKNTGDAPINARAIYLRLNSAIGGDKSGDVPLSTNNVPRLWNGAPGDAWLDADENLFWGFTHLPQDPVRINFWIDEHGGQHPDARVERDVTIAPGEVYRPESPVRFIGVGGVGDRDAWIETATSVLDRVAPRE